jgi:hypothetical protein
LGIESLKIIGGFLREGNSVLLGAMKDNVGEEAVVKYVIFAVQTEAVLQPFHGNLDAFVLWKRNDRDESIVWDWKGEILRSKHVKRNESTKLVVSPSVSEAPCIEFPRW